MSTRRFSVIVKTDCETNGSYAALKSTEQRHNFPRFAACSQSGPVRHRAPGHPVQKASVPRSVCLLIYCHDGGSKKQLGVSKRETELLAKIKKQQEMLDKVMAEKEKVIMQH